MRSAAKPHTRISDTDRHRAIADRVLEEIRVRDLDPDPKTYAVWYAAISGERPELRSVIDAALALKPADPDSVIGALHETYVSPSRHARATEQASLKALAGIDDAVSMLNLAAGSAQTYGASLMGITRDLSRDAGRSQVLDIIDSLAAATHEAVTLNATLEQRLLDTRHEVAQLRETLEAVRQDALTDPLTQLANRKHFDTTLEEAITRAARGQGAFSLMLFDIDRFKTFNDRYGHLVGDQVLKLVAAAIHENLEGQGLAARYGGEEFAVVLPGHDLQNARDRSERTRHAVFGRELVKRSTGETLGRVTVSAGVAVWRPGDTAMSIIDRADSGLLAAKIGGRDRVVIETDLPDSGETIIVDVLRTVPPSAA